jgi:hypothetical protein
VKENAQNERTSPPTTQNVTKEWSVSRVDGVALPFRSGPSEDIQDMAEHLVGVDVRLGDQLAVVPLDPIFPWGDAAFSGGEGERC